MPSKRIGDHLRIGVLIRVIFWCDRRLCGARAVTGQASAVLCETSRSPLWATAHTVSPQRRWAAFGEVVDRIVARPARTACSIYSTGEVGCRCERGDLRRYALELRRSKTRSSA